MHPRNPYLTPPDFLALARDYPALEPYIFTTTNGTSAINFKDETAQRCLTQALLHRDFNLSLTLPNNRLCPPIPNRLNYILWIQDIVSASAVASSSKSIRGIDIGTGASAIYPLLSCRLEPSWHFAATDIDKSSLDNAQLNVQQNGLQGCINIIHVHPDGPIFVPMSTDLNTFYDFTMCNPPFYSSADDVARSAEAKELGPKAVCTGAEVEMITPGGESSFVERMVNESLELRKRCRWYTSMLGKMSSLSEIVALLRNHSIDNYAITEFVQGQTRRWAIAWSFGDIHLPDSIARIQNTPLQSIMPRRNTLRQTFSKVNPGAPSKHLLDVLRIVLRSVEGVTIMSCEDDTISMDDGDSEPIPPPPILVYANRNTWSRSARRKKASALITDNNNNPSPMPGDSPMLKCLIKCPVKGEHEGEKEVYGILEVFWAQGKDRALFESFWSHVCQKVTSALESQPVSAADKLARLNVDLTLCMERSF